MFLHCNLQFRSGSENHIEIYTQISAYLENAHITYLEKDLLEAEYTIVYTKYLLATGDYDMALKLADEKRHQMVLNSDDGALLELTFLTGLGYYFTHEVDKALLHFKTVYYSAHAIGIYLSILLLTSKVLTAAREL